MTCDACPEEVAATPEVCPGFVPEDGAACRGNLKCSYNLECCDPCCKDNERCEEDCMHTEFAICEDDAWSLLVSLVICEECEDRTDACNAGVHWTLLPEEQCNAGQWCRSKSDGGPSDTDQDGLCVPFAGLNQTCGGYMLPSFEERCDPDYECVNTMGPWVADVPGKCLPPCSDQDRGRDDWGHCIPRDCDTWFDGCNTCTRDGGCTEMFCYEPADPPKCLPTCSDQHRGQDERGNCIPHDCETWFDGCNTCTRNGGCSKMACFEPFDPPKCLDKPTPPPTTGGLNCPSSRPEFGSACNSRNGRIECGYGEICCAPCCEEGAVCIQTVECQFTEFAICEDDSWLMVFADVRCEDCDCNEECGSEWDSQRWGEETHATICAAGYHIDCRSCPFCSILPTQSPPTSTPPPTRAEAECPRSLPDVGDTCRGDLKCGYSEACCTPCCEEGEICIQIVECQDTEFAVCEDSAWSVQIADFFCEDCDAVSEVVTCVDADFFVTKNGTAAK
jgi:hypothetical protein